VRNAAALAVLVLFAPAARADAPKAVEARNGMVVSVSDLASEVGADTLKRGGNAVDSAVATAFALAVTHPAAGNIGGGGFMLVHPVGGKDPVVFDYRETAPGAATAGMFADDNNPHSHKTVGIPGTVRGLALAHKRFGKLPWKDVVMPAVKLAEDGFVVDSVLAGSVNGVLSSASGFEGLRQAYGKDGGKGRWRAGDRMVLKDLGHTLRLIAENGPDAFYTGDLADLFVKEMKAGGGLITKEDLAGYRAKERPAVHGTYRGYDVYGAPPPSSGGTGLVEMLNILENFDLAKEGRWSPRANHLIIESMRRAYCDRARYLGDADFVKVPANLTDKAYARTLARSINESKATPSESLAPDLKLAAEGDSTTHFSVIDKDGMAVANTYTLENSYGSRIVVRGAGYLLNNEMTDFNPKPGVTTRKGLIGTPANVVAPGKRMLSSQSPTIVAKGGKVLLVTGSPGSRTIINTVLNVVVNVIDFGMDVQSAVDAPRLHQAWFPDEVRFEGTSEYPKLVEQLRAMGHDIHPTRQGDAHSIYVDPKTGAYQGAADPRIRGKAVGY
jgi:gamma-glutamyltranspeptidase/glutathione hydrolase